MAGFPHANGLTDFSFMEGCESPAQWAGVCDDTPLIFADRDALGGALDLRKAFKNRPVGIGISATVAHGGGQHRLRLHPRDREAWRFLCGLRASRDTAVAIDALREPPAGLSCVIEAGPDALASGREFQDDTIRWLAERFGGRLYIENWQPGNAVNVETLPWQARIFRTACDLGAVPLAAVPVRFGTRQRQRAYLTLRQIAATSTGRLDQAAVGCHLLDEDEMAAIFRDDDRRSLENTRRFVEEHLFLPAPAPPMLPSVPGVQDADEALAALARGELEAALAGGVLGGAGADVYRDRLGFELDVIRRMGFSGYFLIVAEFCRWSRANGVSVGPGRGSGAGSLVARCVGITAVDPVRYGLYFERFLNPDRVSLPDFDVDFAEDGVGSVFRHIREVYGSAQTARIATYHYLRGKSAIKDVARSAGIPFEIVNRLTQIYPHGAPSITEALRDRGFARALERIAGMEDVCLAAAEIEGVKRQMGVHAAGMVIAPGPISDYAPVADTADGLVCTYDMKGAETAGLVKFDILSLKTLSVIDDARAELRRVGRGLPPPMDEFPVNDPGVFDMLARGRSVGVFQFDDMRDALQTVQPSQFTDLVALNALYRPGPIQQIPVYAVRKQATDAGETVDLDLPKPEELTGPVLGETYGIMVYQEQVMEIARICGGFTLAQADMLRRAIGKKIPEEIARARKSFIDGCIRTVEMSEREAEALFALIERFADYGFNKSHAVAYAHIGYVTAWFKLHHPDAWLAALLDREEAPERRDTVVDEARALGVDILGPCVNRSGLGCEIIKGVDTGRAIRVGLGFIKGVGRRETGGAARIIRAREGGAFRSLADFYDRAGREIPVAQVKAIAEAGGFDELADSRAAAAAYLLERAEHATRSRTAVAGQMDLFGATAVERAGPSTDRLLLTPDGPDRLHLERARLGFIVADPDGDVLLDRAHRGKVIWHLAGGGHEMRPCTIEEAAAAAAAEIAAGRAAGRLVVAALVADVRGAKDDASRATLKSGSERLDMVVAGAKPREAVRSLVEAMEGRLPVLCHTEWSIGQDGRPEFRIVGLPPIASVIFDARQEDMRVRTGPQNPGGLEGIARRMLEALEQSGVARARPRAGGIILLTDGKRRAVFANRWRADEQAAAVALATSGVTNVYLGTREFGARKARPVQAMASAPGMS